MTEMIGLSPILLFLSQEASALSNIPFNHQADLEINQDNLM